MGFNSGLKGLIYARSLNVNRITSKQYHLEHLTAAAAPMAHAALNGEPQLVIPLFGTLVLVLVCEDSTNKRHANVSDSNNDVSRDPVPGRTLYPSFSLVPTTAPLVLGTAPVSRLRTFSRFTLADVSWSRLRKIDDGVDEDGRRRRRLPSENKGFDVRIADNSRLLGGAATESEGGCKQLNSETDRQTDM
jgi:hypothetical protein